MAKVKEKCQQARGKDRDAAHERIRKDRSFKEFTDPEGAWNVIARGPVEAGAAFRAVHGPIVDEMFKQARAEGRHEPYEAYAFDAFMELVRRAANTPEHRRSRPETDPAANADHRDRSAKAKATPARYLGIIRIDHTALRRGSVEGDEVCEIVGLGPIPVSVARELLGDAILKLVITKGVDVMNVTHLGRSVTVAQQVALWWQSPQCTRLGCTRTRRLENDHRPKTGSKPNTPGSTRPTRSATTTTTSRPTTAGHSSKATGPRPMVPPDDPRHPKNRPPTILTARAKSLPSRRIWDVFAFT